MSVTQILDQIRSLPPEQQRELLAGLTTDDALREDLQDLLTFRTRQDEPSRPLQAVLSELALNA